MQNLLQTFFFVTITTFEQYADLDGLMMSASSIASTTSLMISLYGIGHRVELHLDRVIPYHLHTMLFQLCYR